MAQPAPQPQDVLDFQFKLQCRLKVFKNEANEEFRKVCSLVTTSSRYGLVFVGTISKQFQVIRMEDIENLEKDVSEYPCRVIEIPSKPVHLSVNCDGTKLCVVVERDECPTAMFYDVLSFLKQQITVLKEIRLSATPNVKVVETEWNPALPNVFTACKSDGVLGVYEFKETTLDIKELPSTAKATCFCWSPKGKQLAVGSLDGKITQYKPDLKAVKVVNPPPLEGSPGIISLKWASSFQFIGIYRGSALDAQSSLIVIDAPKTGNPVYTNFEDICYSYGDTRPQQFYMILEQHWNVLMVASSNSMEVGVLANESEKWSQWILGDSSRAELPLSSSKQDTLPVGMTLNTGTTRAFGGTEKSPMLLMMSHYGQLCCFYAINSKPGALSVCSPPENVQSCDLFKKQTEKQEPAVSSPAPKSLLPTPAPPPTPVATTPTVTQSSFFGGTATPQPSIFSNPPASKPLVTNLFGTQSQISANKNNTKLIPQPTKPIPQPIQVVKTPTSTPAPPTPEADTNKSQTPSKRGQDGRFIVNKETEVMIAKLIHEESLTFEAELKALLHGCKDINVNIGADNEATQMVQRCNSLHEFLKALKETSSGLSAEIHTLKQTVIQTWAWYEEARSRFNTSQDPTLLKVLQGRPLDPASQQQLEDINHSTYYLDSQLLQANKCLDEQWEAFQDSLSKNKKVQVPTMEAIYQAMVKQNATLQKQRYILKDISSRLRTQKRHQTGNILISLDKVDDLQEELEKLKLNPEDSAPQVHYKRVLDRQKRLTKEKSEKLFKFFSKRDVTHVSVSKPQLNNSTIQLTTLLATPLSPIEKKKPDFVMSTPKPQEKVALFKDPPTNLTVIFDKNKGACPSSTPLIKPTDNKGVFAGKVGEPSVTFNLNPVGQMFGLPQTKYNAAPQSNFAATTKPLAFTPPSANISAPTTVVSKSTFSFTSLSATSGAEDGKVTTIFSKPASTIASLFPQTGLTVVPVSNQANAQNNFMGSGFTVTPVSKPEATTVKISATNIISTSSTAKTVSSPLPVASTTSPVKLTASTTKPSSPAVTTVVSLNTATSTPLFGGTTGSFFGQKPVLPLFGTPPSTTKPASQGSIFGNPPSTGAAFSSTPTTNAVSTGVSTAASTPSSIFGATASTTIAKTVSNVTTAAPVSAQIVSTTSVPKVVTTSSVENVVSTPATTGITSISPSTGAVSSTATATTPNTSKIFGTQSTTGLFATPSQTGSIFGGSVSTTVSSSTGIFGGSATTAVSSSSGIFSSSTPSTTGVFATTTASGSNIFGGGSTAAPTSTTTTTQSSIFGTSASTPFGTTTPITSTFGLTTPAVTTMGVAPVTTAASVFGSAQTTVGFGSTTATTTQSLFGMQSTTTTASAFGSPFTPQTTSAFGATPPFAVTKASPFGNFGTAATVSGSVFGQPAAFGNGTSGGSIFGGGTTTTGSVFGAGTTTTGSVFGGGANTTTSSIFGGGVSTATSSVFGGGTTTSTNSAFGGATNTFGANSNSGFGTASTTASPFRAGSVFGTTSNTNSPFAAAASSAPSPFAQTGSAFGSTPAFGGGGGGGAGFGNNSGGAFGFNSLNVGNTTTTTSSGGFGAFGQTNTQNPFGRSGSTTQQAKSPFSAGSVFGTPATTTTASVFGGSSPFSKPAAPAFGSPPAFGQSSGFGQPPAFGQTSAFGSPGFGSPPQGAFSAGGQPVQQTGFSSPAFQKPAAAFGSGPVFGASSPTFGTPSTFGGASTFGGGVGATFGSPQKVFGAAPTTEGTFGTVQNSTFGNLATQNTLGFGNLAQQAATPPGPQPTSFSGGSSFNTWR